MIAALRHRDRGDDGMTLVEVLVTTTVLVVLLGMVLVSMNLIDTIDSSVTSQYQEYDQVIPALSPIRSLVAAEVESAPVSSSDVPTAAFLSPTPGQFPLGNFYAMWTANIGTEFGNVVGESGVNCTSCSAGPAEIVAEELDGSGNPVVSTQSPTGNTSCTPAAPCSFQVRMYLPQVTQGVSSCPVTIGGTSGGSCSYNLSGSYRLIANIADVVNSPSTVDTSYNPTQPIFSYSLVDPIATTSVYVLTAGEVNQQTLTGYGSLSTCTGMGTLASGSGSASCPLDDVQSVAIHLIVNKTGSGTTSTNGEVENQIIDYRYPEAQTSNAPDTTCFPYQFSITSLTPNLPSCNPYGS
jgi:prepilin-type N-terminal cleavage/methylation domain-containing protein